MIAKAFSEFFIRDLKKLKEEVNLYKNESDLWKLQNDIKNSAGNLTLHLIGNLNHFIGAQLGKTDYVRQRDKEFSDKDVPREKLIIAIDDTIRVIENTFLTIKDEDLLKQYPIEFAGKNVSVTELLLQIVTHLNYHLGQINYHRRIIS